MYHFSICWFYKSAYFKSGFFLYIIFEALTMLARKDRDDHCPSPQEYEKCNI